MASIVLLHGGLHEPVTAHDFWGRTGVTDALAALGVDALTPDRLPAPASWSEDAAHVVDQLSGARALPVVGGSNGCSTAAVVATSRPGLVASLALCWPVTAGQGHAQEEWLRDHITSGHGSDVADRLLAGETLRGVGDDQLAALPIPTAVMAADPDNLVHQRGTADALVELLSGASMLPAMPEPPSPAFEPAEFAAAIAAWMAGTPA